MKNYLRWRCGVVSGLKMLMYFVYTPLSRPLPSCLACLDNVLQRPAYVPFFVALLLFTPPVAFAETFHGPVPMRNHHPLYLGLLLPPPEAASLVDERRWEATLDYSNAFLFGTDKTWAVAHDYELAELAVTLRQPVGDRVEIGVRAPLYYQFAGFMDGLLRSWHKFVGVRGYAGQDDAPDYRYRQEVVYDDRDLIRGREREIIGGDVTLWLKGRLWQEGASVTSVALYGQLPTGDATAGLGSGDYEYGARLIGATVVEGVGITGGVGYTLPSRFVGLDAEVEYDGMTSWYLATEWPLGWALPAKDWTLVVQTMGNTSPVRATSIYQYRDIFYDITIGFRHAPKGGPVVSVALSENLNKTNPDFTVNMSLAF